MSFSAFFFKHYFISIISYILTNGFDTTTLIKYMQILYRIYFFTVTQKQLCDSDDSDSLLSQT